MARIARNPRTRVPQRAVTARTMARRARKVEAAKAERAHARRAEAPETLGQARVWDRKRNRYLIAGLCPPCAAQAAYGHAEGFQDIRNPCAVCQPIVNTFPNAGPRGSKWRKILDKLEYMSEEQLSEWIDAH